MEDHSDCLFCKFAKKELDTEIIYENKYVFAFLDINPAGQLVGHTLVVPKKHFENIDTADEKYVCEAMKAIKKVVPAIRKISGADGINVLQNNGKVAGQAIPHLHFHIIPRKHNDGIRFDENRRYYKPLEMCETAKELRKELGTGSDYPKKQLCEGSVSKP